MAVKSNSSEKQIQKEFIPFVGPVVSVVQGINPTLAELTALGYNFQNEPEYLSEAEGVTKVRVDIFLKAVIGDWKSKVTFFIENKLVVNKAGDKQEYINKFGQNSWGTSVEECSARTSKSGHSFFEADGARQAYSGESTFYEFLKTWANVEVGKDECSLEDIKALFKGNFKELQSLVKALSGNSLWVMAIVNEKDSKYYQGVHNRYFGRATSKKFASDFVAYANKQKVSGYPIKETWAVSFQEFVLKLTQDPTPDAEGAAADVEF
jgi:hypothetical protein